MLVFQKKFFLDVFTQIKLSSDKSKDFFKVIDNHLYYMYKIDRNRLSVLQWWKNNMMFLQGSVLWIYVDHLKNMVNKVCWWYMTIPAMKDETDCEGLRKLISYKVS